MSTSAAETVTMRIAELSRRTGVSRETIHFYLREGLIPRPRKTGRNMAYYDQAHVEHIQVIKRLQNEKYLPLSVIKRVLRGGRGGTPGAGSRPPNAVFEGDVELLAELLRLTGVEPPVPRRELARRAGVPESLVRAALDARLMREERDERGRPVFRPEDVELLTLLHTLDQETAFGADFTLELARTLSAHVQTLVRDEARLVFGRFLGGDQPAHAVEALRKSRATVNRLLVTLRGLLMQREIEDYFAQLEGAIAGSERLAIGALGPVAMRLGRFPEIERALGTRLKARPADVHARHRLCALLMGVGRFEAAAAEAERGLARSEGDAALLRAAGGSRFELGDDDAAIVHLARAATADPADPLTQAWLGSAYLRRARDRVAMLGAAALAEAGAGVGALTRSRALPARDRREELWTWLVRGRVYGILPRFLGMFDEGLGELQRLLLSTREDGARGDESLLESGELHWLHANAELLLAQLCESSGDAAGAAEHGRAAADADPEGPIAARAEKLLARLASRRSRARANR
ncbi:MAG TPA: MerR family transcriptional regulator [Myxococcota bacterium]|jgi:DNA-binding transcriptional MerR regulator|nr:MerR family transcriptional regulator [Myxococcota bacterium]